MLEKKTNYEEMKLEDVITRLEEVIRLIDTEVTDLDECLKLYEEGVSLLRICNERLSEAEQRVLFLRLRANGELAEEALDKAEN